MKENKFLKNTLLLAFASIISKMIGFLFKVPLTNMVGAKGIGLFNYSHTLYTIIISFFIAGVPIAMSKMIAERIAQKKYDEAHRIFKLSFVSLFFVGILIGLLLITITDFFIGFIWPDETYFVLFGLGFAPFFVAMSSCFKGYFMGLQNTKAPAIAQIVDAFGRLIFGLGLTYILLNKMNYLAVIGAAIGVTSGSLLGLIVYVIYYLIIRKSLYAGLIQEKLLSWKTSNWKLMKELLIYAMPISIGALAGSLIIFTDSFMVPKELALLGLDEGSITIQYGNLTSVWMVVNLPLAALIALSNNWMPKISELKIKKKSKELLSYFENSIIWTLYLVLPSIVGLYFLSEEILILIFPNILDSKQLLEILSFSVGFMGVNQILVTTLQGLGEMKKPIRHLFIGTIFKVILNYILIGKLGVNGAAIATVFSYGLITILNAKSVFSIIGYKRVKLSNYLIPLISSFIMYILIAVLKNIIMILDLGGNFSTVIIILISGISYMGCMIIANKIAKLFFEKYNIKL